jgi:hypothetical protein
VYNGHRPYAAEEDSIFFTDKYGDWFGFRPIIPGTDRSEGTAR